ncbi:MAG: hypothetical protein ACOH2L_16785 [Devosia sp.]
MISSEENDRIFGRATDQMMDLYIVPEIKRRQAAGLLPQPLELRVAQVLFTPDGVKVRINDELRGLVMVRPGREVSQSDPVYYRDLGEVVAYEPPEEERDFGHFTLINTGEGWRLLFDFRQNRSTALRLVAKAEQFIRCSELALAEALAAPFSDLLFSASELLAKAQLISGVLDKGAKTHKAIHTSLNNWNKLGNTRGDFVALFNDLSNGRADARYASTEPVIPEGAANMLDIVRSEAKHLRERIGFGDF